jgi:hypothetical protein
MARRIIPVRNGSDRLVIRTIRSHLIFFHEAGFAFSTERRQGSRWVASDEAEQPHDLHCTFNDDIDAASFGATPQSGVGSFKLTAEVLSLRRHCVFVVEGNPESALPPQATGADARAVRDVVVQFTYDGDRHTLRHSD